MLVSTKELRGKKVLDAAKKDKKVGKIEVAVFHPKKARLVGFIVKRPDAMMMIKRSDRFVAWDRLRRRGDAYEASAEKGTWDEDACKRLDVDYDKCIVWEFMPIVTNDDQQLGHVESVLVDRKTGRVKKVLSSDGAISKALLGRTEIPAEAITGYRDGAIVVNRDADEFKPDGGLAGKAGAASAKARHKIKTSGKKAGKKAESVSEKTGDAADESIEVWGRMFKETKRAFDEAKGSSRKKDVDPGKKKVSRAVEPEAYEDDEDEEEDEGFGAELAQKFGRGLGKAGSMFSAFKEEYKKEVSDK